MKFQLEPICQKGLQHHPKLSLRDGRGVLGFSLNIEQLTRVRPPTFLDVDRSAQNTLESVGRDNEVLKRDLSKDTATKRRDRLRSVWRIACINSVAAAATVRWFLDRNC